MLSHRETKWQQILHKLTDERSSIEEMLSAKITFENDALARCRHYCSTHRIGNFIRPIAAEFQFDRKKLTIYVMKSGDASVCKLVRKLFDSFKIRISILDIESPELARHYAIQYLHLTGIKLPLNNVFIDPSIIPYVPPTQQLGKSKASSLQQSLSQYSAESLHRRQGEFENYPNTSTGYYPQSHGAGYTPDSRYDARYTERVYQSDYSASSTSTSTYRSGGYRQGYFPSSSGQSASSLDDDYYRKDIANRLTRESAGGFHSAPDEIYRGKEVNYTLAEHQELANYYRGNEKYQSQSYYNSLLSSEEDYGKYYREADQSPPTSDPSLRDIDPYLGRIHNYRVEEGYPNVDMYEYAPFNIRKDELPERYDPQLIQSKGQQLSLLHAPTSSVAQSYSSISSMNRSHPTYPIDDEEYQFLSPESHQYEVDSSTSPKYISLAPSTRDYQQVTDEKELSHNIQNKHNHPFNIKQEENSDLKTTGSISAATTLSTLYSSGETTPLSSSQPTPSSTSFTSSF